MLSDARGWISLQGQLVQHPQFLWYVLYWWLHIGELSAFPSQMQSMDYLAKMAKAPSLPLGIKFEGKTHVTKLFLRLDK
jgi:hypothetical protein